MTDPRHLPVLDAKRRFALLNILVIPGLLALIAYVSHASGLDLWIESQFFDPAANTFPARNWHYLELIGHHLAKDAAVVVWVLLLIASIRAARRADMIPYRPALWAATISMAAGPLAVVILKDFNSYHCPWDLKLFGGAFEYAGRWFAPKSEVGYCFPGGHAASGFSLFALYFLARQLGKKRLSHWLLLVCILAGAACSFTRMWQGAHFLSHNIWTAAICWCVCGIVFLRLQKQPAAILTGSAT